MWDPTLHFVLVQFDNKSISSTSSLYGIRYHMSNVIFALQNQDTKENQIKKTDNFHILNDILQLIVWNFDTSNNLWNKLDISWRIFIIQYQLNVIQLIHHSMKVMGDLKFPLQNFINFKKKIYYTISCSMIFY